MHKKIGIYIRDLGCSELNYCLIKQINALSNEGVINPTIFIEEVAPVFIQPKCSVMQSSELWGFYDTVVCTNLSSAQKLIKIPTVNKKIFYVWDFEWFRFKNKNNELMSSIYNHKDLQIINKTQEMALAYKQLWGKDSLFCMEDFDVLKLVENTNG